MSTEDQIKSLKNSVSTLKEAFPDANSDTLLLLAQLMRIEDRFSSFGEAVDLFNYAVNNLGSYIDRG